MADIKLFVCCHRPEKVPEYPLLVPVQVGTALSEERFLCFLHDDDGENISEKNRSYCELTAQYWAWKNVDADYYGFFHYRRYLYPNTKSKLPYRIEGVPGQLILDKLGFKKYAELIEKYDLIAPIGENMHIPVREHYANAPHHHGKDLELIERIIRECHPQMVSAMEKYLSGTICYFGNIYIMKRQVFQDYCAWLFPILEDFDRRADKSGYSAQELRVNGYLAERLFGVWYEYHRTKLRTIELPRVHFGPPTVAKRLEQCILPPGSKLRATVKKIVSSKR